MMTSRPICHRPILATYSAGVAFLALLAGALQQALS